MEWYEGVTEGLSVNKVALKAGIVQSTLNRQVNKKQLSPETVIAIARAYHIDVAGALISLGFITADEVRLHGVLATLKAATDRELAAEIARRLGCEPDDLRME